MYLQFKREYWEHKSFMLHVPLIVSTAMVLLFSGILLFSVINNDVQIRTDGLFEFSNQVAEVEVLLDDNNTDGLTNRVAVDHSFAVSNDESMQQYPELLVNNPAFEKKTTPHESVHLYKTISDSMVYRYIGIFNGLLLIILFIPFMQSLTSDKTDHSILFWRSLPVSESKSVLTKFTALLVITPLIYHVFLYLALLCCLGVFYLVELAISPIGTLELTKVFAEVLVSIIQMGCSFIFILAWFLPLYCLMALMSSFNSKSLWGLMPFAIIAVLLIESFLFNSNILWESFKAYVSLGFSTAELIRWHYVWPAVHANIDTVSLISYLALSAGLISVTILLRRRNMN